MAYIGLTVSLISAFLPVIRYKSTYEFNPNCFNARHGFESYESYSVIEILSDFDYFRKTVLDEYNPEAEFNMEIGVWQIVIISLVGVAAIVFAIIGLRLVSKQKENVFSFILTLFALLLTMVPSVLIFSCVFLFRDEYLGEIRCGAYPIISPIAMIICIIAVTQVHRRNVMYKKKAKEAQGLIFRGGNL